MYRCAYAKYSPSLAVAFALAASLWCLPGAAQVQRNFPPTALRGELVVGVPPLVSLNGDASQLAPGARIRGQNNMLQMSGSLEGSKLIVNYTLDMSGQIRDVWILTSEEASKRPWPKAMLEAQTWRFDFGAQTWTKP